MLSSATMSDGSIPEESLVQKYTAALHRYYQLKSRYEGGISTKKHGIKKASKSNRERRDMFRKFTPLCVSCGRKVGSTFTNTIDIRWTIHLAKCGDTKNPCQLDIELKSSATLNIRKERDRTLDTLHEYGEKVIRLTNDGMFGYINGDAVVELHEIYEQERAAEEKVRKNRDALIEEREDFSIVELNHMNGTIIGNKNTQIQIHDKVDLFNEHVATIKSNMKDYARSGNRQFIRDSIHLYANEMRNNLDSLNNDKYARMAVEATELKGGPTAYTMFQDVTTIDKWLLDDIEPQVVRFAIGKKLSAPEKKEREAELVPSAIPNIAAAATAAVAAISSAVLAEPEPDNELVPTDDPSPIVKIAVSDDDVSDAESEDDEPLPRIQIGDTVDTSSDDGFVPPPPPISDMELSSSDEGFVQPPAPSANPADEIDDSSSDGYIPPPPPMDELEDSSND
jgi:hypothetical protein